mmetsp:Transcript_91969/g.268987  ORF Transcript_91969/g.268987 Transcript_91969/m.268987 type:complete len:242 (-) Transcript_91969:112-837(-)
MLAHAVASEKRPAGHHLRVVDAQRQVAAVLARLLHLHDQPVLAVPPQGGAVGADARKHRALAGVAELHDGHDALPDPHAKVGGQLPEELEGLDVEAAVAEVGPLVKDHLQPPLPPRAEQHPWRAVRHDNALSDREVLRGRDLLPGLEVPGQRCNLGLLRRSSSRDLLSRSGLETLLQHIAARGQVEGDDPATACGAAGHASLRNAEQQISEAALAEGLAAARERHRVKEQFLADTALKEVL